MDDLYEAQKDVENYRNLWEKEYKYTVYPSSKYNKWYNKTRWTKQEIDQYHTKTLKTRMDKNCISKVN